MGKKKVRLPVAPSRRGGTVPNRLHEPGLASRPVPSAVLYFLYLAVMTAGLACFIQAWRHRLVTPVHKRWGITGTALSLGGIAVVLLGAEFLGWVVDQRLPWLVTIHRRIALASTALLILTAVTGAMKARIHKKLYVVFLPLYVAALVTAIVGYRP